MDIIATAHIYICDAHRRPAVRHAGQLGSPRAPPPAVSLAVRRRPLVAARWPAARVAAACANTASAPASGAGAAGALQGKPRPW